MSFISYVFEIIEMNISVFVVIDLIIEGRVYTKEF